MKFKNAIGMIGIILFIAFITVAARNFMENRYTTGQFVAEVNAENNGNEQIVQLGMKDYNYYPNVLNLKYNVPAKIVVDADKVKGCLKSIVIPDFGIRKNVKPRRL